MFPINIHRIFRGSPTQPHPHGTNSFSLPTCQQWKIHLAFSRGSHWIPWNGEQLTSEVENSFDSKMSQAENPCEKNILFHPFSTCCPVGQRRFPRISAWSAWGITIQKCCKNLETHGCSMENGRTRWKVTEKPWGITEKPGSVSSAESDLHLGSWVVI